RQVRTLSWSSTRPGRLRRRRSSVARFPASSTIRPDLAPVRHDSLRNKLIVGESLCAARISSRVETVCSLSINELGVISVVPLCGLATTAAFGEWRNHASVTHTKTRQVTVQSSRDIPLLL